MLDREVPSSFLQAACKILIECSDPHLRIEVEGHFLEAARGGTRVHLRLLNHENLLAWQEYIEFVEVIENEKKAA